MGGATVLLNYFGALTNKYTPRMAKMKLGIQTAMKGYRLPEMAYDFEICMKRM